MTIGSADTTLEPGVYPVVIIGGGLAGSVAAAVLAQAGYQPVLIERDTFPRDKLCGEFLSGESQRLLRKIGCLDELLKHDPPRMSHGRFIATTGRTLTVTLPEPSLGISRRLLDETLFRHACSLGATGMTDSEVRDVKHHDGNGCRMVEVVSSVSSNHPEACQLKAMLTIGAYGRHARLDHNLGRPFVKHLQSDTGFKLHHRFAAGEVGDRARRELQDTTEMYGLDGGYCGIGMVEGGLVNVCMLLQKRAMRRVGSNQWQDISAFLRSQNAALASRLDGLIVLDNERVVSVSRMPFSMKEQAVNNDLFFIGDAAGMIAPLCGGGQAMALESGVMLAEMIVSRGQQPDLAGEWKKLWRGRYSRRLRIGRALQFMQFRPAIANVAIALLQHSPQGATSFLARATRSSRPV